MEGESYIIDFKDIANYKLAILSTSYHIHVARSIDGVFNLVVLSRNPVNLVFKLSYDTKTTISFVYARGRICTKVFPRYYFLDYKYIGLKPKKIKGFLFF